MKSNQNRIIKAIAVVLLASMVLCACQKQQNNDETTTALTASTTAESTTAEPTTESTTAPTTTAPTTTAPTTTTPTTAKPTTQPSTKPVAKPVTPPTTTAPATEATTVPQPAELNPLQTAATIIGYYFLTPEGISETAAELADSSNIYYVRLEDGNQTFYIAVDLQTAQALSLANPQVLRALCKELEQKQQEMADGEEYVLMDYTHLVGELELHYVGYLLTGALGGEDGPLASFYNSCKVADLNVDENRFGPIIDIIGTVYG